MSDFELLKVFDIAHKRSEMTISPTRGWIERIGDSFLHRFRVETKDLTSFQKYYNGDYYIGCIFNFTEWEKQDLRGLVDFDFSNATGFYITPHTMIHPHTDNSPKRSQKTTIIHLTGSGSKLRLHDAMGNTVYELPDIVRQHTLYPSKVIHSFEVGYNEARLINFWHD